MKPCTLTDPDQLKQALHTLASNQDSGSLIFSNPSVVKRFNLAQGNITAWSNSNKERHMTSLGLALCYLNLVSSKDVFNAFAQERAQNKHYCQILVEQGFINLDHLQAAARYVVSEEICEALTWGEGKYELLNQHFSSTSLYESNYLESLNFAIPLTAVLEKIPAYLEEWRRVCSELNSLQLVPVMNALLASELQDYLQGEVDIYDRVDGLNKDEEITRTGAVFDGSITPQLKKDLALFSGKTSLGEAITNISSTYLDFCNLVSDLIKCNYLRPLSAAQLLSLADQSQQAQNVNDAKKFYQLALAQPDLDPARKNEVETLLEAATSGNLADKTREMLTDKIDVEFPGYEILEELGKGAMGRVYKARQKSLNRFVAIKVVPPAFSSNEMYLKRLELEAKAMARLKHPNIVSAIDFGLQKQHYYIIMEYVEGGKSLRHLIEEKGKLNEQETLEIGLAIAGALKYLADHQLVHRDIKPGNILVDKDGTPKLADLGLIKDTQADMGLTLPGTSVGTPAYMSPEQLQAQKDIDIRSDIYSLGASMLHAVTGKSRFGDTISVGVIYHKIISQRRPKVKDFGNISEPLDRILTKTLQPNREDRYQTPQELFGDIQRVLAGNNPELAAREYKLVRQAILAATTILVLTVVLWAFSGKPAQPKEPAKKPEDKVVNTPDNVPKPQPDTPDKGKERNKKWEQAVQEKNAAAALAILQELLQTGIEEWSPMAQAWLYYYQGNLLKNLNKRAEAQRAWETALTLAQTQEIVAHLGSLAIEQNRLQEAIKYSTQALALPPLDSKKVGGLEVSPIATYHLPLARVYLTRGKAYLGIKDYKLAVQEFTVALGLEPNLREALQHRFTAYLAQQDHQGIVQDAGTLITLYPEERNYRWERARSYLELAKYQEAVSDLKLLAEKSYRQEEVLQLRLQVYRKLGNKEAALQDLNSLLAISPQNSQNILQRGILYEDSNNLKAAVKDYNEVIRLNPKEKEAVNRLVRLYQKYNKLEQLLALYDKLLGTEAEDSELLLNRARLYVELKRYREATSDFAKIIASEPRHKMAYFERGVCYYHLGETRLSLADLSHAIQMNPEQTAAYYLRGVLQEKTEEYDMALADFSKFLSIQGSDVPALTARARCYMKKKEYEQVISDLGKVLQLSPGQTTTYEMRGECQMNLERYEEAMQSFKEAARYGELSARGYNAMGFCYAKLNQIDKAVSNYRRAIERDPNFAMPYLNLGVSYHQQGQYNEAVAQMSKVIALEPKNEEAYYNRGQIHIRREDFQAALGDFTQLLRLNPAMAAAYYYRGFCYYRLKKNREAAEDLQNYLRLEPQGRSANTARKILQMIKK
jgi:serine/threonine protein kinase/lipoprotein NlpI